MYQLLLNHILTLQAMMIMLLSSDCEGTSTALSPLGMVTVCPGGQGLLTCERMSGFFLYWNVSIPHLAMSRETIISSVGAVNTTYLQFDGILSTAFNITRTSISPLTSQMMINNVTTEINGSTIYCSNSSNENGAPMATINVINEESNNPLNVTMVNHFLRNYVIITLQWPRKAGAVYHVNILPETPRTELINTTRHDHVLINLTISYNIQYNVSIASRLCVTTTKVLQFNYVTCDLPSQLSGRPIILDTGSQEIPHREGQFITYTCPTGLVLTGPNASVCTGNGEWEPDPGQVDCIADCGVPQVDRNVTLSYNTSTLEGSILTLSQTCENDISNSTERRILRLNVTCHSSGNWIPDPAQFTCSPSTTVPPGTEILTHSTPNSSVIHNELSNTAGILGGVLGVLIICAMAIIFAISAILCLIKKGFLHPKRVNRSSDIKVENTYHSYVENSSKHVQPVDPVVQQATLIYADIGPSSVKKRGKHAVTLRPDDMDDRVEYAVLNHSLQKPATIDTKRHNSVADDSLNLDTLLIQVRGAVTPHWYQLGQALEVSKDVLDKCSNYPPEESIVEVLDQWLRNFPGRPTWRDVTNALRRTGIQQLANEIEMVYETGKLPIQVDDNDDTQQVLTATALELPQQGEETTRTTTFNISGQNEDESAPPLPPKPLAGSDVPKKMLAPPRPPKYTAK